MSKITASHLSRTAYVYVRQSTMTQVQQHLESQRRQYALAARARQLGWERVVVIDEDLGHSGSGTARAGFDRLLDAVTPIFYSLRGST
jgi:DNA invertase Pin-like site-specific DNA recombinase